MILVISFLPTFYIAVLPMLLRGFGWPYLFQCLVVDKARSILGNLELPFLNLLAELPMNRGTRVS